jgi:hypothetical protein
MERGDERTLLAGLDRLLAVRGADPRDGLAWRYTGQHREARQSGACAPVPSEAPDLNVLAAASAVQYVVERDP